MENVAIGWQNRVLIFVEILDLLFGLSEKFSLVLGKISRVSLCIAELPDLVNLINYFWKT